MKSSAIILSGGHSRRFGMEKGLIKLCKKPLIVHVFDSIVPLVNEVIIVTSAEEQLNKYSKLFKNKVRIFKDEYDTLGPIVGALKGFEEASGEYSILLPCDAPLISRKVISLLLNLAPGNDAVVPRWPNGFIEPLQAIYHTHNVLKSAKKAVKCGDLQLNSIIRNLKKVRYIATKTIKTIDQSLNTFINVNDYATLELVEQILEMKCFENNYKL